MTAQVVRTPDDRFRNLPGFSYEPHYLDDLPNFPGLRMHYLDEGPADGHVVLCLHGQPTWSYLYRKMIPVFVAAGHRVVAPDLFGFGRSDKPIDDATYTWSFHRESLLQFVDALELTGVTFVVQDWGGILGLTLPIARPGLVERLLVMNTALTTATHPPTQGFLDWRAFVASQHDLDIAKLMRRAVPGISEAEAAAYAAPFPDASYKAGVRRFPAIVPITPEMDGVAHSREAARWWQSSWTGPTFMAVGAQDPVLGLPVMQMMRRTLRGCCEPLVLEDAGHFVQESGEAVAEAALAYFAATSD